MDSRVRKLADVLTSYSIGVKPGEVIGLSAPIAAEPLMTELAYSIVRAGGNPIALVGVDGITQAILAEGSDEQLVFEPPHQRAFLERIDALIGIFAPVNTRALGDYDAARMAMRSKGLESMQGITSDRTERGEMRWCATQYPTNGAAQAAGMSLRAFEDFVYGACLLDEPDPAAAWQQLVARQTRIIEWLSPKSEVHIVGAGTDLRLGIQSRTWINDEGHVNFPAGEVFTAPIEDSVEGSIAFNFPAVLGARGADGVRLEFRGGKVVDASAETDDAFLQQMLDMDAGARILGEFAFGTNPGIQRFTRSTLFDEKIGGTLHMALGRAYPETGGTNVSALHWDMVYDLRRGARVDVDGEEFSRDGRIVVA